MDPKIWHGFRFIFCVLFALGIGGCQRTLVSFSATPCLNTPWESCGKVDDSLSISSPADIFIFELSGQVDVDRLEFNDMLLEQPAGLKGVLIRRHPATVLPGGLESLSIYCDKDTRYLLFFFAGRHSSSDEAWKLLVRRHRLKRNVRVEVRGLEMREIGKHS